MKKLSEYEKELIVLFNESGMETSIYTFNVALKRRLTKFRQKSPALCRLKNSTGEGRMTHMLDKSRMSVRLVSPCSEERRATAREYARKHGFQFEQGYKGRSPCWG